MIYMYIMQFIFSIIGMALLGYFAGEWIRPDSELSTILTAVGTALGVMIGFATLVRMMRNEARYERTTRH